MNKSKVRELKGCLVTVLSPYFLFPKTILYFKTKNLVWQSKMDKTKIVLKIQFVKETKKCKKLFLVTLLNYRGA